MNDTTLTNPAPPTHADPHRPHAARPADIPLIRASATTSARMRYTGLLISAASAALLTIAATLPPDARGIGTHEKLGLPPCGFIIMSGLPCPTCGMTTAFANMLHGHPIRSFLNQPLGAALCIATFAALCVGLWMAATKRYLQVDWFRISPATLMLSIAAVFFLAWGAKIGYGFMTGELPYHR